MIGGLWQMSVRVKDDRSDNRMIGEVEKIVGNDKETIKILEVSS